MPSLKNTVISATALAAMVQFCPAPFLAMPAAVAAGIGAVSTVVGTAASVAGTVDGIVENSKGSRVKRRQRLAQRAYAAADAEEGHKLVAARQEQNQLAWQLCHDQLTSASLTFSAPSSGDVLVEGMPPACMTLSTVITGNYNTGNPVPQGSDSMLFQNLTADQIQEIQDALDGAA